MSDRDQSNRDVEQFPNEWKIVDPPQQPAGQAGGSGPTASPPTPPRKPARRLPGRTGVVTGQGPWPNDTGSPLFDPPPSAGEVQEPGAANGGGREDHTASSDPRQRWREIGLVIARLRIEQAAKLRRQLIAAEAKARWAKDYFSRAEPKAGGMTLSPAHSRGGIGRVGFGVGIGLLLALSVWMVV